MSATPRSMSGMKPDLPENAHDQFHALGALFGVWTFGVWDFFA